MSSEYKPITKTEALKNYVRPFYKTGPNVAKYLKAYNRSEQKRRNGERTRLISDSAAHFELNKMNPKASNLDLIIFLWSLKSDYDA
jgi:hypothetical protein